MKTIGQKIKALRMSLDISQQVLADAVESTQQSIYRYESGKSLPDTTTLIKLATFFDVSTDYLLGITGLVNQLKEEQHKIDHSGNYNMLYKRYLQSRNIGNIIHDATYYRICSQKSEGEIIYSIDMQNIRGESTWVGWADEENKLERRKLRPVNPERVYERCCRLKEKPMIINSEDDALVFMLFGGNALVKHDICEQCFPQLLEEHVGPSPDAQLDYILKLLGY